VKTSEQWEQRTKWSRACLAIGRTALERQIGQGRGPGIGMPVKVNGGGLGIAHQLWRMPLIGLVYYGDVEIAPWEWLLCFVYFILLYGYFSRMKNMRLKREPEYRHFLWGLFAKVLGGIGFSLIYFYYYKGGDTLMYFYSAVSMSHLAMADPSAYFRVLFGPADYAHLALFGNVVGQPYGYMYFDPRAFMVIRLISPLVILSLNSYVITTILLSSVCYIGVWRCYQTFVGYFPSLTNKLAIAFLYMPSVVFWGSGVMKDTFTLSATCWWVHCFDELFFKKRNHLSNLLGLAVAGFILVMMKPYIFMALMPMTLLWVLYFRVVKLKNILFRFIVLPMVLVLMVGGSYLALISLDNELGKFSLNEALETTMVIQEDLKRSEQYGDNYFDIGTVDGTLSGILRKFPVAVNAALFRPYLWEARNAVMALSGLENAWLLGFTVLLLWRTRLWFFIRCLTGNPLVMLCIVFAVLFAFIIGLTTPNFGALVRFKIPLVPFLVAGLFIIDSLNRKRLLAKHRNQLFRMGDHLRGEVRPRSGSIGSVRQGQGAWAAS
jgi:hypothetical protein